MYGPEVTEIQDENLQHLEVRGESDAEMFEALATWLYQQGSDADVKVRAVTMQYDASTSSTEPHLLTAIIDRQ